MQQTPFLPGIVRTVHAGGQGTRGLMKFFGPIFMVLRYRKNKKTGQAFRTVEFALSPNQSRRNSGYEPVPFICQCGGSRFSASQLCHHSVIVDGSNTYQEDGKISEIDRPYGPYTCLECGRQYDSLDPRQYPWQTRS